MQNNVGFKALALFCLIAGEALSVYSEMIAAKAYSAGDGSFLRIFAPGSLTIALAGALLIAGYMLGYASFKNIWLISVVSVTSILIVEPGLTYLVFRELPGRGAAVGLGFGALGFLATLVL